jgi:hypothetical protein
LYIQNIQIILNIIEIAISLKMTAMHASEHLGALPAVLDAARFAASTDHKTENEVVA